MLHSILRTFCAETEAGSSAASSHLSLFTNSILVNISIWISGSTEYTHSRRICPVMYASTNFLLDVAEPDSNGTSLSASVIFPQHSSASTSCRQVRLTTHSNINVTHLAVHTPPTYLPYSDQSPQTAGPPSSGLVRKTSA